MVVSRWGTSLGSERSLTPAVVAALGANGVLGAPFPVELGGLGWRQDEVLALVEQAGALDLSLAAFIVLHYTSVLPLLTFGHADLVGHFAVDLVKGRRLAAFALTESAAGSNPRAMKTRFGVGEHGFLLRGEKSWCGNAAWADLFTVFARSDEHDGGITAFAVPRDTRGLTVGPAIRTLGLHALVQHPIRLDNVHIPRTHQLGDPGAGLNVAERSLGLGRLAAGAMALGALKRCAQLLGRFTSRRQVAGGLLIDQAATRERLAMTHAAIVGVSSLLAVLDGADAPPEAVMALKVASSELLGHVADGTLQLLGSRGYDEANGVAALVRDARFLRLGEGPSEVLLARIGAAVAYREPQFRAYLTALAADAEWTAELVDGATHDRLGQAICWLLLVTATRARAPDDVLALSWLEDRLAAAVRRVREATPGALFERASWASALARYDHEVGELDDDWPVPDDMRDPWLRRTDPTPADTRHGHARGGLVGPERELSAIAGTVVELIERAVDRTPDAIAVVDAATRLSFRALDAAANVVAHALRSAGVTAGSTVAVLTACAVERAVAVLGAIKAGARLLVLDGGQPVARRILLLQVAVAVALVGDETAEALASATGLPRVAPRTDIRVDPGRLGCPIDPQDIVAVVFTSGSTGQPKAVLIPHVALVNQLVGRAEFIGLTATDRVLHTASPAFDVSLWELLGPLAAGASVAFSGETHFAWDPGLIARLVGSLRITLLQAVPSQLPLLTEALAGNDASTLRALITGGEPLPRALQQRVFECLGCALFHFYGPAEATIDATAWVCRPDDPSAVAPIGRVLPNRRAYILDAAGAPVGPGEVGELCLGGIGIAAGYLNGTAADADRFQADPLASDAGARRFRSGDRVRDRGDGVLLFHGRVDRQIKLRGVRIEPGEVEAILCRHPRVEACHVTVREPVAGDPRLVAFVAVRSPAPTPAALRLLAQEHLPAAMVPADFVCLDRLPTTPLGKVDPSALPAVTGSTDESPLPASALGPTERWLAALWGEVLGRPARCDDDDFFAMGGHSLTALQLLARVRAARGVDLSLRGFLQTPTLGAMAATLDAANQPTEAPLSAQQATLWFLDQLGDGGAYNESEAIRVRGPLSVDRIHRALRGLADRHPLLRTVVRSVAGQPRQVVLPTAQVAFAGDDLTSTAPEAREQAMRELVAAVSAARFDLETGPLVRLHWVRMAADDHVVVVVMHHIVGDGWSFGILGRELAETYAAITAGRPLTLPALPMDYATYARGQQQPGRIEAHRHALAAWCRRLDGLASVLDLPLDHPRPAVQRRRGAAVDFIVDVALARALTALGRRVGATLFHVVLAGLAIELARACSTTDVAIGTAFANRPTRDLEGIFGLFANTVVLRLELADDPTVAAFIAHAADRVLEAHEHPDLPFQDVVQAVAPERSPRYDPLVQVFLSWQTSATLGDATIDGCTVEALPLAVVTAKFDLHLSLRPRPDGSLAGRWEFNRDLFEPASARRMVGRLNHLWTAMVTNPDVQVSRLDWLTDEENHELERRALPLTECPVEETLFAAFARRAAAAPGHIAVVASDGQRSYAALHCESLGVARRLAAEGVTRGDRVALLCARDSRMVSATLGVLAIGAAYVPLDPAWPAARITAILEQCGARVLVVTGAVEAPLMPDGPRVLVVDAATLAVEPMAVPPSGHPDDVAYVIYTSGSTGRPKGVRVSHRNVIRLFSTTAPHFGFDADDVWTLFHSLAFDFSVWEMFGALLTGGRLVVVPHLVSRSPSDFHALLTRERVTILSQTPSAFLVLDAFEAGARDRSALFLRWVVLAGEKLSFDALAPWFARHGDEQPALTNMYGITETTVHSTFRRVRAGEAHDGRGSRIGAPLADTAVRVLDVHRRPVAVGTAGELWIGGAGVALGYDLVAPEHAGRFVPDPMAADPTTARPFYRSGDCVRMTFDGDIEYLHRLDHQVKLRGFRIELGEIETCLRALPGVVEAAVILSEPPGNDAFLAAFVVPCAGVTLDVADLLRRLVTVLPTYMLPRGLTLMARLPLTPNGKLDRRALHMAPLPTRMRTPSPLRTEMEAALWRLWRSVLAADDVGVTDDFFELGGQSLMLVRLAAAIEASIGRAVPLVSLLQHRTIEQQAELLAGPASVAPPAAVWLEPMGRGPAFACVPGSGGMFASLIPLARHLRSNCGLLALPRRGFSDDQSPDTNITALARHALTGLRSVQHEGRWIVGGHSFGAWIALDIVRMLESDGATVAGLVVLDMPAPALGPAGAPADAGRLRRTLVDIVESTYGVRLAVDPGDMASEHWMDTLCQALAAAGVTSFGSGTIRRIMDVLSADERALADYPRDYLPHHPRDGVPIQAPILLLRTGTPVPGSDPACASDITWGWGLVGRHPVTVRHLDGDHASMLGPSHAEATAGAFRSWLTDLEHIAMRTP